MPGICAASVQACAARFTRLDECGNFPNDGVLPTPGPLLTDNDWAASNGFVSIGVTPNYDEGETFEVDNACGTTCVYERECPELRDIDLSIDFCKVDPELFELISGVPLVLNAAGDAVGHDLCEGANCTSFALETWTRIPNQECDPGQSTQKYWYWLWPLVYRVQFGDLTLENGPVSFSVSATTKPNPNWGVGPWNDVQAASGAGTVADPYVPGPMLTPLGDDCHFRRFITELPLPTVGCGYATLGAAA